MNCKGVRLALAGLLFVSSSAYSGQSTHPDFSGTWLLDREKSDLKSPPINIDQPRSGGGGGGAGGSRAGGGRGMGGGGSGGRQGGGRGGGGMGGSMPRGATTYSPMKLDLDFYQIGEVADRLTIEHADPAINIKPAAKTENSDQPLELRYTADGKARQTTTEDGGSIKSKTSWEGLLLVTKSKEQSTSGSMEIVEARSLSADGNTLTINLTFKGSSSHWTEKAVYLKEKRDSKPGGTDQ
jgi:hypothetical protein